MKRVLLTGAAGHVASAVRPELRTLADEVVLTDHVEVDDVALRIGTFVERPQTERCLSTWLSRGDARRLVRAALTGPVDGFLAVYGVSANTRGWWDLPPALGYVPQDDAEAYADDVEPGDGSPFQGGPNTARDLGGWA